MAGIVEMCITGYFMELWKSLFTECGLLIFWSIISPIIRIW